MRRFFFGAVIASFTTFMPAWAIGGDREIAKAVMAELQQHKAAGNLKGFDIDLKVEDGVVYLNGKVANREQRALVAHAVTNEVGASNLVNNLQITSRNASPAAPSPVREAVDRQTAVLPAAASNPQRAAASDLAVTDRVISKLQQYKSAGQLRGFELDVSTVNGDVWLRGKVGEQGHKDLILDAARRIPGVLRVVDDITVIASNQIQPASTYDPRASQPAPIPVPSPEPVPQVSSMPMAGRPVQMTPQAFAPSGLASMQMGGVPGGQPVAMQGAGAAYGAGAPRYDQPNMPSYAWPSYAAHPNYGAVTYPQQYSPSAWPYIGPFYPYPQVPLGWRKVALEWDDGLWYLDFTSK